MTTRTLTIGESIPLPQALRSRWQNKRVSMQVGKNAIIVKFAEPASWKDTVKAWRAVGKEISPKTLKDAIAWARKAH